MVGNSNIDSEFLQGFVADSQELLDQVEPHLIELQESSETSGSVDGETLNSIFRLFHSLKGSSDFLRLENVKNVTHEAETLLNFFREGKIELDSGHTDLLCRTCDLIRKFLLNIEEHGNDKGFESEAGAIIEELREACAAHSSQESTTAPAPDPELQLTITPEMITHFVQESDELLQTVEQTLLDIEKSSDKTDLLATAFRGIHSFKGNCGFLGYADLERLSHKVETVFDDMKSGAIKAAESDIGVLLEIVDVLRNGVADVSNGQPGTITGLDLTLQLMDEILPGGADDAAPQKLGEILVASGDTTPDAVEEALEAQNKPLGEILVDMDATSPEAVEAALEQQTNQEKGTADALQPGDNKKIKRRDIRVDLDKLDNLLNLVGELVIAQSMVTHNPDLAGHEFENFAKAAHQLERVTAELQYVAMNVRMIPVSGIFRKMLRVVHDLSGKCGKKIRLIRVGEETEVDKTVIEQIADPLVHIIRNAIDHGIESAEERRSLGKPEASIITLEAKHDGGEVLIIVHDDGRGLDRDKILAKAIERGLVKGDGSGISDEDIFNCIFEPGFSTADTVTNVSGRGVGMDVVKKNIDRLKGRVDIRSRQGEGATVILRIPLTLAIMDGMLIRVGAQQYTIPLLAIRESFRPAPRDITVTPDGQEVVRNHGELLPIVRLHDLYNVSSDHTRLHEGILVTVDHRKRTICLFVDEVLGQQQAVIKGLSDYYVEDARGVSGCTILGDGTVSLILDVNGLIEKANSVECSTT